MFEKIVDIILSIKEICVPFATSVIDFMTYQPLGDYTVFEYIFGIGLTAYLVVCLAKFLLD